MSTKSYSSRSKSHHHSDEHRREKRDRRQRYDDDRDSEGRDRDRDCERDKRKKKSKKRDRYDDDDGHERREHSRSSHKNVVDSNSEGDADDKSDLSNHDRDGRGGRSRSSSKVGHRDRHSISREKSSNKRRKKSSRSRSGKHSDDNSDHSSDYDDRRRSNDRKKKKKSSKSRQEKKDKKSSKAPSAKKPDKSKMVSMGKPLGRSPDSKVNAEEDYFSYHNEFWIYLFREEGTCFNDIDTEESRAAFARFAKQYNAGMLEDPYYTRTFPNEVIEESKTTKHSWGFKTTHTERKGLGDLQKGVRRQTEYSSSRDKNANNVDVRNANSTHSSQVICQPVESLGSVRHNHRPTPEERRNEKRADRRLKEHVKLTQEELTGGPKDGKERQLEKKREHSARIHGAHKDHEVEAAGMELSDAALFGDDVRGVLGRSRQKKERKDERQKNRIQELQQKEEERQKNMLKMLGLENLQGKKKLVIAPRK
jgi:hypothetical protein